MTNQESEQRRIVVETPTARREEVHSEAVRYPDRNGLSGAALAAIVVGVVALAAIIILFALNRQQEALNENMTAQQHSANDRAATSATSHPSLCNSLRRQHSRHR